MEHMNSFLQDAIAQLDQKGHCNLPLTKHSKALAEKIHNELPEYIRKNTKVIETVKSVMITYY